MFEKCRADNRCETNGNVPKKAERMNTDLASQNIYGKGDQKSVTAWLDVRNDAAHGKYNNYTNYLCIYFIRIYRHILHFIHIKI